MTVKEKLNEELKDINNILKLLRKPILNEQQKREKNREYKRKWRLRNIEKERERDKKKYWKKASTEEGRAEMKEKERIKWQRRKERNKQKGAA